MKLTGSYLKLFLLAWAAGSLLSLRAQGGLVTSSADDGTSGTLRAVIAAAAPGDTITFDSSLAGQTIILTGGPLVIDRNLVITGLGANHLAISGNHTLRIFEVNAQLTATIQGLTIRDGFHMWRGGAVSNLGTLALNDCFLTGHRTPDEAAAINNEGGTLTISRSTFSDNSAWPGETFSSSGGGAIWNWYGGTLTVTQSTFSDNHGRSGGAISNAGTAYVSQSTFTDNSCWYAGGAIMSDFSTTIKVKNCIFANNVGDVNLRAYETAEFAGVNLSDDNSRPEFIRVTTAQLNLSPLADNGGPTPTIAPIPPSVAIDTDPDGTDWFGDPLTTDQRGMPRPQGPYNDVGAFEQLPQTDAPVPAPDSYTFLEDSVLTVAAPGVLGNDSDPHGAPLSIVGVIKPAHGTLVMNADGSFSYAPTQYYDGPDSFYYIVTDSFYGTALGTVNITVVHVNHPPFADNSIITTPPDSSVTVPLTGSDVDGDALVFAVVSAPAHGTLSGAPPALTYTPDPNFAGTDSFKFKANDGALDSALGVVTINRRTIWDGPKIRFVKADGTDGSELANQDEIVAGVRLARNSTGGLYNAALESASNKDISPLDTEWAYGTTADLSHLSFFPFIPWTGGYLPQIIDQDAVLHLISKGIYVDLKFTSWSCCGSGGFAYQRSTPRVRVTLNGAPRLGLLCGASFIDPGAAAQDSHGQPLEVRVSGTVDTSAPGTYLLVYSATDADGYTGTANRIVDVGDVFVNVYSGFHSTGGGAPYSGPVGSFSTGSIDFATQSNYGWHPFGLNAFGAEIWGTLDVERTGPHTFVLESDDGSILYIDGNLVINNGGSHGSRKINASIDLAAGRHCFQIEFFNSGGASGVNLFLPEGVTYACPALNYSADVPANSSPGLCGANVAFALPNDPCLNLTVVCRPTPGSFFPLGSTPVTCQATDSAGDVLANCSFNVTVHDTIPPTLVCPGNVTAIATSAAGTTVNYPAANASHNCSTPVITYSTASGSVFDLGTTTVTATAVDGAGNSNSCSFKVNVAYSWSGVLQPINADGSSVFKLGMTVPVKFQLTADSAGINNAAAKLSYVYLGSSVSAAINEATSTATATTGNLFRYDSTAQQYVFNWSTKGLATGSYLLQISLGDGVARTVTVGLK